MKPVSLRLKNFGPFIEEQQIDFAALEKSGLFLIYGNTGSGKTTLLDAICCALYCSSSNGVRFGGKGKSALEKMRCQQAKDSEPTFVEFIFDSSGRRYRFYREIRLNRGGVNFNEEHVCGVWNGEVFVPPEANLKMDRVSAFAEQIIGLTADQFRQVVILPQGKFEQLLTSESSDKEAILSGIFHMEKWDRVTGWMKTRLAEEKRQLERERAEIDFTLGQYDCVGVDALDARIGEDAARLAGRQMDAQALREEIERLEQETTALERLDEQFVELDKRTQKLQRLSAQADTVPGEEAALNAAAAAEKIRPFYDRHAESAAALQTANEKAAAAKKHAADLRAALDTVQAQLAAHSAGAEANEEKKKQVVLYEKAVDTYRGIDEKKAALSAADAALRARRKDFAAAEKAHADATAARDARSRALEAAEDKLRLLRAAYDANIGSVLAAGLTPGRPCPVCGSTTHPHPAVHTGDPVTKEAVDLAEDARNTANDSYKQAREAVETRKQAADRAKDGLQTAETAAELARAAYDTACKDLIDGIADLPRLTAVIAARKKEITAYAEAGDALNRAHLKADGACREADALLAAAADAQTAAADAAAQRAAAWASVLEHSAFADEAAFLAAALDPDEALRRREALAALKADLKTAQAAVAEQTALLAGKARPAMDAVRAKLKEKKAVRDALQQEVTLLADRLAQMRDAAAALKKREIRYRNAADKTAREQQFYEMIDGRNGISLKRYVLGIMLDLVTGSANDMLRNIYGGRYRIRRSNQKAARERAFGLAFEIEDLQCGKCRNAADISGGEKFLVSLSLAIGLSDVVRAQEGGIDLESIFIDEGFGTLDRDCLNDALYVLQTVREKNGMVGVISHVEELAETITARIETTKTAAGSRCDVFYE